MATSTRPLKSKHDRDRASGPSTGGGGANRPASRCFSDEDVRFGYVSGLWGVRGAVKLYLYNAASDAFDAAAPAVLVLASGKREAVRLQASRGSGKRIAGVIDGVHDRSAAARLVGAEIVLTKSALPSLDPSEFYHRDLLGLPVQRQDGQALGRLGEIYSTGEVDTWVVRGPSGEHYLAALAANIVEIRLGDCIVVSDDVGGAL